MTLQKIIERGLQLGLEAVEIYASTSESNTIKLDEGKLETYNTKEIFGVSIRGLKDGKMGYVYTETLDDEYVEEILNNLVQNIATLDATEPEFMYEGGSEYQEVPELKADYKQYTAAEKIAMLQKLEKEIKSKSEKIVKVGYCQYSEASQNIQIINSKGLDLHKSYSYMSVFAGAVANENDQTVVGVAADINTEFKNLELDRIINESTESALAQLGAGDIKTGNYPVVFKRDVATEILSAFTSIFSGVAVIKKMTILADKVGQKVFGNNITIYDDPFYTDALVKTSFDDEGVPCRTKTIVENGVFNGFLHNLKTANFLKAEPTGNGFKAGVDGGVSVSPTNLYIKPGKLSKDEIISTIDNGIYVTEVNGLHAGLNPISGDFNVQASGFVIENGKLGRPITLFVVSGNFYEMMNQVEEIGNDIEKRFNSVASPTLKFKQLAISGK